MTWNNCSGSVCSWLMIISANVCQFSFWCVKPLIISWKDEKKSLFKASSQIFVCKEFLWNKKLEMQCLLYKFTELPYLHGIKLIVAPILVLCTLNGIFNSNWIAYVFVDPTYKGEANSIWIHTFLTLFIEYYAQPNADTNTQIHIFIYRNAISCLLVEFYITIRVV